MPWPYGSVAQKDRRSPLVAAVSVVYYGIKETLMGRTSGNLAAGVCKRSPPFFYVTAAFSALAEDITLSADCAKGLCIKSASACIRGRTRPAARHGTRPAWRGVPLGAFAHVGDGADLCKVSTNLKPIKPRPKVEPLWPLVYAIWHRSCQWSQACQRREAHFLGSRSVA